MDRLDRALLISVATAIVIAAVAYGGRHLMPDVFLAQIDACVKAGGMLQVRNTALGFACTFYRGHMVKEPVHE